MDGYTFYAKGPQDELLVDSKNSLFKKSTLFEQYTDFSVDTIEYFFGSAPYLGTTQTFSVPLKSVPGDLISNMFLKCTLPTGQTYVENVGRALISSISLYLDSTEIETFDDDWYIIRDQLFLDTDEKAAIQKLVNTSGDLYIPLEFFFSRRNSPYRKDKSRKPWLPICCAYKQTMYVTIQFQTSAGLCGVSGIDLSNVKLVVETVTLTDKERTELIGSPQNITVQRIYKEPVGNMVNGTLQMNLTVGYKVSLTVWFLRYQLYETNTNFYNKRYDYGYITNDNFINKNLDPFDYITIYVDGQEITDKFSGTKYFTYLQPLLSKLSTPSKKLYMYSFGLSPNEYNNGGYFDFKNTDSNSTFISMKINSNFVYDITTNYFMHVYHYGYSGLEFSNGVCSRQEI